MDTKFIELNGLRGNSFAANSLSIITIFEETLRSQPYSTISELIQFTKDNVTKENEIEAAKKKAEKKYKSFTIRKGHLEGYISDIQTSLKLLDDNSRMKESYQSNLAYYQGQLNAIEEIKLDF